MRTPSRALPAAPHGCALGRGRPLPLGFAAGFFTARNGTTFFVFAAGFAAAFLAGLAAFFGFLAIALSVIPLRLRLARASLRKLSAGPRYFLRSALCGLRLPMRPLSLPDAGSITALISVGLPE